MDSPVVVIAGFSTAATCGVRDHAQLLDRGLSRSVASSLVWSTELSHDLGVLHSAWKAWIERLRHAADSSSVVVVEYSVFAFAWRGVPLLAMQTARALRPSAASLVVFAHEPAYLTDQRTWRNVAYGGLHRIAFAWLTSRADLVVFTSDERKAWFTSRWYFRRRHTEVSRAYSNLPVVSWARASTRTAPYRVGLAGFASPGAAVSDIVEALGRLSLDVEVVLLGEANENAREIWVAALALKGLRTDFVGRVDAVELSNRIASVDLAVFCDRSGPSSRRGTVAALLAAGVPLVAFEGHEAWQALMESGAVLTAEAEAESLKSAVQTLLADHGRRVEMSGRAIQFSDAFLSLDSQIAGLVEWIGRSRRCDVR